ncbi:MAG: type II toxin-antitoxin system HicB family antitoxin [Rubrobacter sp.]|jgi:predicted RNase H-like HicB family nuclease|nr:type II toxin-antitoxin system HicB family antitoxin [Rubrobacter sp.]
MTTITEEQATSRPTIETSLSPEQLRQQFPDVVRVLRAARYEPDPIEVYYDRPLPVQLIKRYAMLAASRADTERLDDGGWYAEVPGFPGVWAQEDSESEVIKQIETVVRDWTVLKILDKDRDLPIIGMIDLNVL